MPLVGSSFVPNIEDVGFNRLFLFLCYGDSASLAPSPCRALCIREFVLEVSIGANQPDVVLNGISSHRQRLAYRSQPGDIAVMFSGNISGGNQL